jgi:hypothetical protein
VPPQLGIEAYRICAQPLGGLLRAGNNGLPLQNRRPPGRRRLDEARATVARLRAITPVVVPSDVPYRKPEDRELLLSGLRLAGETS